VILDRISDGGNGHGNLVMNWFSDTVNNPHVSGGDITRDKRKLAFQTGTGDNTLTVYFVRAFPTSWKDGDAVGSDIQRCYRYSAPSGQSYSQPTFSPDGAGLAFGMADGVHVATVPNFQSACTLEGATPDPPLVIPGGSEPDWGPADVPAARAATPAPAPTQPAQPTTPPKTDAPSFSASVKSATKARGVKLTVKVPGKGKLSAVALAGKKTVGKASATVKQAGTAALKLSVKKKGKLKVKVTFTPATGAATTKTLSVTVR